MAIDRRYGYSHLSLADPEQAGTGIAFGENAGPMRNRFPDDAGGEAVDMLRAELAEKIAILQHRALVGITRGGQCVLGAGHAPDYSRCGCGINGLNRTAASCLVQSARRRGRKEADFEPRTFICSHEMISKKIPRNRVPGNSLSPVKCSVATAIVEGAISQKLRTNCGIRVGQNDAAA